CLLWAVVLRLIPDAYFAVVLHGVINAIKFVVKPVSDTIHIICRPAVKAWRAVKAPAKRASIRMVAKVGGKKIGNPEEEVAHVDEEAMASPPVSVTANPPPITLTAPS